MTISIHIGYAKTATTYLQEHIYPNLDGIRYDGRFILDKKSRKGNLDWVYDFAKSAHLDIELFAKSHLNNSSNPHVLLSHEVLMRPFKTEQALVSLSQIRSKVEAVNVIVSIRKQVDLIFSRYVHDISKGIFSFYELEDALDYSGKEECLWPMCGDNLMNKILRKSPFKSGPCLCNRKKCKSISIPYYNLERLYDMVTKHFGAGNVHFIVSEALKENPELEVKRLCDFLSKDSHMVSFDPLTLQQSQQSNQRSNSAIYQELKAKNTTNGVLSAIETHFSESNKNFSEKLNLNQLNKYGYF